MTPQTLYHNPGPPVLEIADTYQTPAGYKDFPYIYVFDGHALVSGQTYRNLSVRMDGEAEFILRGIFGWETIMGVASKFQYRNNHNSYKFSAPMIVSGQLGAFSTVPAPFPVVPEERYAPNGAISFDLYGVVPSAGCRDQQNGTMLGFAGVKRMPANYCFYETQYHYRELPYTYKFSLTVDWAGADAAGNLLPPKIFTIPINDRDFELQRLRIANTSVGAAFNTFQMVLFDNARRATSSGPVPWIYLADQSSTAAGPLASFVNGSFTVHPTPPLVYMVNGVIQFAIYSNYCTGDGNAPYTFDMCFDGVQRMACQ